MDFQINWATGTKTIHRGEGITSSERYLQELCERSFLSLWIYPDVYSAPGKQVCDLLVVFDNHVLIFSDKHYKFPNTGNLQLDWDRWFRGAIAESAKQIYGAERKLTTNPDKLFLDAGCKYPFPLRLPSRENVCIHRIVVAHGASERCKELFGGSGSLSLISASADEINVPFTIPQVNPQKGFTHVFDDITLDIVLRTLDTITDFLGYLSKKEEFFQSGTIISVAGEEDLLAHYLQ